MEVIKDLLAVLELFSVFYLLLGIPLCDLHGSPYLRCLCIADAFCVFNKLGYICRCNPSEAFIFGNNGLCMVKGSLALRACPKYYGKEFGAGQYLRSELLAIILRTGT